MLSGKYFIDELYERVIGRPLVWISDRIFLRLGDRALLDGTLNGLAALAPRQRQACSARMQTGSLHLYAWLVLARHRRRADLELAPCLMPALLNLVLFLPLARRGAARVVPAGNGRLVRAVSLVVDGRSSSRSRRGCTRASTPPSAACSSRRACRGSPPGACTTRSASTATTSCWWLLTAFLGPLVVAGAFTAITKDVKLFYAMVFLVQFAMIGTFLAQDLFLFYVFWEAMLIPMFLLIGIWGGERRIYATIKFVLYTAFGSILMLAAVIYLVWSLQTDGRHHVVRVRRPRPDAAAARRAVDRCSPPSRSASRSRCRWRRCTPGCPTRTSRRRPPAR